MATKPHSQPRANAIRIELNGRPEIATDRDAICLPPIALDRYRDAFAVYEIDIYDDAPTADQRGQTLSPSDGEMTPAAAWRTLNEWNDTEGVFVMAGPGASPVVLCRPVFLPNHWRVWEATEAGAVARVGDYLHRLSAMQAAKAIIAAGRCPIVATPYMASGEEWDTDFVVRSSEATQSRSGDDDA